jgi:hypothetical protein
MKVSVSELYDPRSINRLEATISTWMVLCLAVSWNSFLFGTTADNPSWPWQKLVTIFENASHGKWLSNIASCHTEVVWVQGRICCKNQIPSGTIHQ